MKYEKLGFGIKTNIDDDYVVRANIVKADGKNTYNFTLEISSTEREMFVLVPDNTIFQMESERINSDVADYIKQITDEGCFNSAIIEYEKLLAYEKIGRETVALCKTEEVI